MFCNHCGAQLPDEAKFCGNCGNPTARQELRQETPAQSTCSPGQPAYAAAQAPVTAPSEDTPSGGLNFLAFLIPIVGLILFLSMKNNSPVKAKSIGKWTLIGGITGVVLTTALIFLIVVIVILTAM